MARLLQPPSFYGTCYGICTYKMYGQDFIRKASSLTGERVKTEAVFKNTMSWAHRLAAASRLASAVYAMLPVSRRKYAIYRKLTGKAMRLLKEGIAEGMVVVELMIVIRLRKRKRKKNMGKVTVLYLPAYSMHQSPVLPGPGYKKPSRFSAGRSNYVRVESKRSC